MGRQYKVVSVKSGNSDVDFKKLGGKSVILPVSLKLPFLKSCFGNSEEEIEEKLSAIFDFIVDAKISSFTVVLADKLQKYVVMLVQGVNEEEALKVINDLAKPFLEKIKNLAQKYLKYSVLLSSSDEQEKTKIMNHHSSKRTFCLVKREDGRIFLVGKNSKNESISGLVQDLVQSYPDLGKLAKKAYSDIEKMDTKQQDQVAKEIAVALGFPEINLKYEVLDWQSQITSKEYQERKEDIAREHVGNKVFDKCVFNTYQKLIGDNFDILSTSMREDANNVMKQIYMHIDEECGVLLTWSQQYLLHPLSPSEAIEATCECFKSRFKLPARVYYSLTWIFRRCLYFQDLARFMMRIHQRQIALVG